MDDYYDAFNVIIFIINLKKSVAVIEKTKAEKLFEVHLQDFKILDFDETSVLLYNELLKNEKVSEHFYYIYV